MKKLLTGAILYAIFATTMLAFHYRAEANDVVRPRRNVHRFFYRYDDEKGYSYLKALFPPIVITYRMPKNKKPLPVLTTGDVLICREYRQVAKVVEVGGQPLVVHEMVLDCENARHKQVGRFIVKGMNFRGD